MDNKRYRDVLESTFKIRRRLKNLNDGELTRLENVKKRIEHNCRRSEHLQDRLMSKVKARLLDIQAHQGVLDEQYSGNHSYSEPGTMGIITKIIDFETDFYDNFNDRTMRRLIELKKLELNPDNQRQRNKISRIEKLKRQNRVVLFDRTGSSLTDILDKYSMRARKNGNVHKPKVAVLSMGDVFNSRTRTKTLLQDSISEGKDNLVDSVNNKLNEENNHKIEQNEEY